MRKAQTTTKPLKIGKIFLLASALVLVLLLIITTINSFILKNRHDKEVASLAQKVQSEVLTARSSQESTIKHTHQNKINFLADAKIVSSIKSYSRIIDICTLSAIEQGWVAKDWTESCHMEYSSLIPTDLTKTRVLDHLKTQKDTTLLGQPSPKNNKMCTTLFKIDDLTSIYYYDHTQNCDFPKFKKDHIGLVTSKDKFEEKVIETYNPADLDTSKSYIGVFTKSTYYTSPPLGCAPTLFCNPPFSTPVTGF